MARQFWLSGKWDTDELEEYPEIVEIAGRVFRRARWRKRYPGVVEQYREDVRRWSMHMKVYDDGTWSIDHIDAFNPDKGPALRHFLHDHPMSVAVRPGHLMGAILWHR